MTQYKSAPVVVNKPAGEIFNHFNDLTVFEEKVRSIPQEQRSQIGDLTFTPDSISINTPQLGQLTFQIVERVEPSKVVFGTPNAPIKLNLIINLKPVDEASTEVETVIDVELPAMLRPFIGPKLQQAADKFGDMIANLAR